MNMFPDELVLEVEAMEHLLTKFYENHTKEELITQLALSVLYLRSLGGESKFLDFCKGFAKEKNAYN